MSEYQVRFDSVTMPVTVQSGALLIDAARLAGIDMQQPCGGQGRCGRCAMQVTEGPVRQRSTIRLSLADIEAGLVLACQSVIEGDVSCMVLPQERIERKLASDLTAAEVTVPPGYDPVSSQTVRRVHLTLGSPNMNDQTDDWSRLQIALRQQVGITRARISLDTLRHLGSALREGVWQVTAVLDESACDDMPPRLIDVQPGHTDVSTPLLGAAIDIGTTTVTLRLVDLLTGEMLAQTAEYNGQIARGEDVISRIIYDSKNGGRGELRDLVLKTINDLLDKACKRIKADPADVVKATVTGNSTMTHLLLGIPAESIRLTPFITAVNQPPLLTAGEVGIDMHPQATVDCLPGIASYVGADITAGVLASGTCDAEPVTLFMDIGTNGEIVLGNRDWLVACACSAGPAFEGAGVLHGMRATRGAVEEVWIDGQTGEPTLRVIGGIKPRGLCGSGLISLLAEMFISGLLDKSGNINLSLSTPRVREGEHGAEYVVAWADETTEGRDIVITRVDIDNLLRAKAAIYAGITVLAESVGVPLTAVEQVLIGGAFGKYINIEKAIEIGLLPDMPWEQFQFLGNTSVQGAYLALLDREARTRVREIATQMTYIELSADNRFFEAFTSALFLPHTDLSHFPSVQEVMA